MLHVSPVLHGSKKHLYNGILVVDLPKGNLRNLSCVRRAPSEPVSVFSVVKKSRVKFSLHKNALHRFEVAELEMSIRFEVRALGPFVPRIDGN